MFRLDAGSSVPIYRQLVQQVRQEVMLGRLRPGEQLPTVKEVVESLSVNPNTVVKAYAELEHEGMVVRRQGVGTFVASSPTSSPLAAPPQLLNTLVRWVGRARRHGLTNEHIRALMAVALDEPGAHDESNQATGGVA